MTESELRKVWKPVQIVSGEDAFSDEEAAHKWRLHEAAEMMRALMLIVNDEVKIHAMIENEQGTFFRVEKVLQDSTVLAEALRGPMRAEALYAKQVLDSGLIVIEDGRVKRVVEGEAEVSC